MPDPTFLDTINYPPPCYPFGLRYHPTYTYNFPYKVQAFAYTDRLHGKAAIYYPDRDKTGVIEITTFKDGDAVAPVKKHFFVDHSTWYESDIGDVVAMDMSFGYDYQRLYILFKQNLSNGKTYRAWLSMYDINRPSGTIFDNSWGIPMYGFIKDMIHLHPFSPENLETVIDYIKICGMTGDLFWRPELDSTFNLLCAHDKIFVTMPVMFKPRSMPWDKETEWTVLDARCLYQVLFMFDETAATFNSAAVIGALSTWPEGWETPVPDIFPRQPLKTRMFISDGHIGWQLSHYRVFPKEWFTERETRFNNYHIWYLKGEWDAANMVDHYWQPLTTEAIHIKELIQEMEANGSTFLKPLSLRAHQYYGQTPLVSDLYSKAIMDWSYQRAFGSKDHQIQEYEVKYHNFKRKILTGFEIETTEHRTVTPVPEQVFHPTGNLADDMISHIQSLDLKPGTYTVKMKGADGGYSTYGDTNGILVSSLGGKGATVSLDFDLLSEAQAQIYVGLAGSTEHGGVPGGGNGGRFYVPPEPSELPTLDSIFTNGDLNYGNNNAIIGDCQFVLIPKGYKNIRLVLSNICFNHNISLQILHMDGTLLTGSVATRYPPKYKYPVTRDEVIATGETALFHWPHEMGEMYGMMHEDPKGLDPGYNNMWFPYLYRYFDPNSKYVESQTQAPGLPPAPELITEVLKNRFPNTIPDTFAFNDNKVNGTGNDAPYVRPTTGTPVPQSPYVPGSLPVYNVDGESIEWTGSIIGSNCMYPSYPYGATEECFIAEAQEDLLVGLVGIHTWDIYTEWEAPSVPVVIQDMTGGGGGGLTGFFLDSVPVAIAGAGGGGGYMSPPEIAEGGHGGTQYGGWGRIGTTDLQQPGGQDTGYAPYQGQRASTELNPSGGGGAGFYGGTADQTVGINMGPGGGGGSSFVIGAQGYSELYKHPSVTVTSFDVQAGQGTTATPEHGWVSIEGEQVEITYTYKPLYVFLDHELGDFYYQCAGKYITPDRVADSPLPPGSVVPWDPSSCTPPDPVPMPGVPNYPIPYIKWDPPTPSIPDLDIIFLADMTGSMSGFVKTIGNSMETFVTEMQNRGFVNTQYAFSVFNDSTIKAINRNGTYFTKSGTDLKERFAKAQEIAGHPGGLEAGGLAITSIYNEVKSQMLNPNGSPGQEQKLVHFVMITDEPCWDSTPEQETEALDLIGALNAGVHWVIPVGTANNLGQTRFIQATVDQYDATLVDVMDYGNSWGGQAASRIIDAILKFALPPTDTTYSDWFHAAPLLPSFQLAPPSMIRLPSAPPLFSEAPGMYERPRVPGYTLYHTFAIENLACSGHMCDVKLRSKSPDLKLGLLSEYDPDAEYPILPPDKMELTWDDIPPHSEVLFNIYTELKGCALQDLIEFEYHLEWR